MANEEHLKILRQGVEAWNQWRIKTDITKIDLSKAVLSGISLYGANLYGAILYGANLSRANLCKANLSKANLCNANLSKANFSKADLSGADLSDANLSYADISGVDISETNLSGAKIRGNLQWVNLSGVNLSGADLSGMDFSGRDLRRTNLSRANIQAARFINANLDGANLTGAYLWEAQRAGWSIKGVICEYVYWDEKSEEKTFYQPSDFERLFSEQKKIKLFYKDGANLLEIATLPSIIKNLEEKHPGCKLSFQSIEETSGGAIATLVLEESKDIAVEEVEAVRALIQAEAERNIEAFRQALDSKDQHISQLRGEVQALDRTIDKFIKETVGKTAIGDTYNISGPVGAAGREALARDNTLNQIVNEGNSFVETQIQGERNIAVDGDASDSSINTGDKNNDE